MTNQRFHQIKLLEQTLADDFVPYLPPLQNRTRPPEEQNRKNLSRAFGAFVLKKLCDIAAETASKAVIDDFDDYGIDVIYYYAPTETLYCDLRLEWHRVYNRAAGSVKLSSGCAENARRRDARGIRA